MIDYTNLTKIQTDTLQEVITIATGNAATALSQITGKQILIKTHGTTIVPVSKLNEVICRGQGLEQLVIGLFFRILGEMSGRVLLVFPKESARNLTLLLLDQPQTKDINLYDIEKSTLMEIGNIVTNCYLNGLSHVSDLTILPSIPHYAQDMMGAVLDYLIIELAQESDYALMWETEFSSPEMMIRGDFLIFPEKSSLDVILNKLGIA